MYNFSYENYIEYGWGSEKYGKRTRDEDKFWIKYGRCEREPKDFRSECINAAKLIYKSTEKKIVVHYSGGIDSEIVCRSFLEAKVPFEVVTWVYANDFNKYDIKYAIDFCNEHGIKQKFIELDIREFCYKTQFERYKNDKYFMPIWQANLYKYVAELTDGFQICGDEEPHFIHDPLGIGDSIKPTFIPPIPFHIRCYQGPPDLKDETYKINSEYVSGNTVSFFSQINKTVCKDFFCYTPELLLSYIRSEFIQDWLKYCKLSEVPNNRLYPCVDKNRLPTVVLASEYNNLSTKNCSLTVKPFVKYKNFPETKWRPKYTGLEKIRLDWLNHLKTIEDQYHHNIPGNEVHAKISEDFIRELEPNV
jgi:hypothetical protein